MKDPKQAFVEYVSSHTNEAGGLVSNFIASQDARLSDGEVNFKEIIRDVDESRKEGPNKGEGAATEEPTVEYFDTLPTRDKLTYHKYLMSGPIPSIFLRKPIITEGCPSNFKIP
ncbi:hypothetical protein Tco_0224873 [Tanacetum coccineum]